MSSPHGAGPNSSFPTPAATWSVPAELIPAEEVRIMVVTVASAFAAAAQGDPRRGYILLLGGLQRADTEIQAGRPWAGELADRYRHDLSRYVRQYGEQWGEGSVGST